MKCILCGAKFNRHEVTAFNNSPYCFSCQEYDAFGVDQTEDEEYNLDLHNLLNPNGKTPVVRYDE